MRSSSIEAPQAINSPSGPTTSELPSKSSSSCPPTWFTYATMTPLSAARVASMRSRQTFLPAWNGEALMLTISCAPLSAISRIGPPGNQTSSQMVTPTSTPPMRNTGVSRPGWK